MSQIPRVATRGTAVTTSIVCLRQPCSHLSHPSSFKGRPARTSSSDLCHEQSDAYLIRRAFSPSPGHHHIESLHNREGEDGDITINSIAPAHLSLSNVANPRLRWGHLLATIAATATVLSCVDPAWALQIRPEPSNALSVPTWAVHVSSVIEWVTAMVLFWRLAEVSGNEKWKGMTWGMMPLLGGALSACTYHFFYNPPELDNLVVLQAALTVAGNFTLWLAAYRIFAAQQVRD